MTAVSAVGCCPVGAPTLPYLMGYPLGPGHLIVAGPDSLSGRSNRNGSPLGALPSTLARSRHFPEMHPSKLTSTVIHVGPGIRSSRTMPPCSSQLPESVTSRSSHNDTRCAFGAWSQVA